MSHPLPSVSDDVARLRVDYVDAGIGHLDDDVLAAFVFGHATPAGSDPRVLRVPLAPFGDSPAEVWRVAGPVRHGVDGAIRWAADDHLAFGVIELAEGDDGIEAAARRAYAALVEHVGSSAMPHLLRIWNYFDAITLGEGDAERYRRFCVGRAEGLGAFDLGRLPAATAIGRCDGERVLQVYWLSAREPGIPVENPRQVSAYRYPRQYGPQPPSFARAMLPADGHVMPLLLSGTAAVVGHASQHDGELLAQIEETFANFDALLDNALIHRPDLPAAFGPGTRLKVYVRDRADLPLVADALTQRFGDRVPRVILHAAVCRRELAVEIDGVHG
ncbi:pteridine-dependent deoxygenase [Luteimonas yindakuii]|uniref:chorismate transformation enzyme, FkbO/Hyg5 family n=1 Tax=Luteimonas yindakuii TaxID=2565782 RepID=UPI00140D351F